MRVVRKHPLELTRRNFLRGLGGVTLTLPWLESLHGTAYGQSAGSGPRRVIVMTYEMGVALGQWRPSDTGSSFTLPYTTEPLEPFRDRCLFVSSIDNTVLETGGSSFVWGHPAKREAALTGTLTTNAFPNDGANHVSNVVSGRPADGTANGPSVDHLIGQFLRQNHALSSVDLGVDGNAARGPLAQTRSSAFCFEGRANPVSLRMNPSQAWSDIFALVSQDDESDEARMAMLALRARNKSVLDAVRQSFHQLSQGLGREDRERLEAHAERIRELERDVRVAEQCSVPELAMPSDYSGWRMDQLSELQVRILAHAMACDLAPVGRLEFTGQQDPRFGIEDLDSTLNAAGSGYDWHAMVHGDALPGSTTFLRPGRGPELAYDARLLSGYRFFVEQFAQLLHTLDEIPEGPDGSVLDNSLVVLASDLGEGLGHGHHKMCYVLAGNLGEARRGYHFDAGPNRSFAVGNEYFHAPSRYNVNQLLNSMMDMAGVVDAQGQPVTVGLQGYLEGRGLPRRIDGLFS